MASTRDFSQLAGVEGVSRYLLVRNDGTVLANNADNAQMLAITIMACGQHCEEMGKHMRGHHYIHLNIERQSGNNLLVFSLGGYYLGIIEQGDRSSQETVDNVITFLKTIS